MAIELNTYGDLKKVVQAITSGQTKEKIISKGKEFVLDQLLGLIPGASGAKSALDLARSTFKAPDTKKTSTWLDKLNIDDDMSKIVDDNVENGYIQNLSKNLETKSDNEPLPEDFDVNKDLQIYLAKTYNNRTVSKLQESKSKNKLIYKILKEILEEEGNITGPGEVVSTPKIFNENVPLKKGRRFIPSEFEFPESLLKPIGFGYAQEAKTYFKIATNSKGESVLMIDPLVKTALDSIERGRSSFNKEQKLSRLTQYLKERVPQEIRGIIKKYSTGKTVGNGYIALPLIMDKRGDKWVVLNPSKEDSVNSDINVPLYEGEIEVPDEVHNAAERLANLLNSHFKFGQSDNSADTVLDAIIHKRLIDLHGWFDVADASDRKIKLTLLGWRQKCMKDAFRPEPVNESQIQKLIKQTLLKEASYGQFKKEVKFRSKNEMLHKGIKTVKSKLQEVDRIVEYMSRMKQELSENEDGLQYWDKTKQSINKIQEIVEALNNKIKTL